MENTVISTLIMNILFKRGGFRVENARETALNIISDALKSNRYQSLDPNKEIPKTFSSLLSN